jgi:signal transduction histidine kinase
MAVIDQTTCGVSPSDNLSLRQRQALSGICHNLRAPLIAIKALAERLRAEMRRKPFPPRDGEETLEKIVATSDGALRLTAVVTLADRLAYDRTAIHPTPQNDLAGELTASVGMFADVATAKRITLRLALRTPLPPMVIDTPTILDRVVNNLIANAIKRTPRHGAVQVSALAIGDTLRIIVADSGPNVPPHLAFGLFDPRDGVDNRNGTPGNGRGLSIAHRVAALHGGQLYLDQGYKGGAAFVVKLPLRPSFPPPQ